MDYQTLGLVVSLTVNMLQYLSSWHKQNQSYELDKSRLELEKKKQNDAVAEKKALRQFQSSEKQRDYKFRLDSQNAAHQHELDKLRLNESIEVHHSLVPQLQKIFSDYIAITTKEVANSTTWPMIFSPEQKQQEKIVCLYCPDAVPVIEQMNWFNESNCPTDAHKDFMDSLTKSVVPVLAKYLSQLPKPEKGSDR